MLSALSALLFLYGGNLWLLLLGRVLSGLSAGLFTATATIAVIKRSVQLAIHLNRTADVRFQPEVPIAGVGANLTLPGMVKAHRSRRLQECTQ